MFCLTQFGTSVCTRICRFSMKKRPKMAVFLSKIEFIGLRQAVQDLPSYFEGAGYEKSRL